MRLGAAEEAPRCIRCVSGSAPAMHHKLSKRIQDAKAHSSPTRSNSLPIHTKITDALTALQQLPRTVPRFSRV